MPPSKLDLFSKQASLYAKFRPKYPQELFDFVESSTPKHKLVWDVGTGNGQAAVELSKRYEQVVATDLSAAQIAHAEQRPNIRYAVTPAVMSPEEVERTVGPAGSVDLVTVAQALHWFDFPSFYDHVKTVLRRPGGVIAAWGYGLCHISPAVDEVMHEFYAKSHPYWEPQRAYLDEGYRTIPFDFAPVTGKDDTGPVLFESSVECSLAELFGYLDSWSACQTARDQGVTLMTEEFEAKFKAAWGEKDRQTIRWPVFLRLGTIPEGRALVDRHTIE